MIVDGGRNSNNIIVAVFYIADTCCISEVNCGCQVLVGGLQCTVVTGHQFVYSGLVNVETGNREFLTEFNCKWQADISQADYTDFYRIVHINV